jgi:hypothetical protein
VQVALLSEMESFGSRSTGTADTWAESIEGMLTEELDGRLRAHRPRAGRIVEEVRVTVGCQMIWQPTSLGGGVQVACVDDCVTTVLLASAQLLLHMSSAPVLFHAVPYVDALCLATTPFLVYWCDLIPCYCMHSNAFLHSAGTRCPQH